MRRGRRSTARASSDGRGFKPDPAASAAVTALDSTEITERLAAVERRLTDGEGDARPSADAAAVEARVSDLEARADDIEERLAAVESGLDALRGLVGEVDRVDESIERRADAALAGVDDLESRVAALEDGTETDASLAAEAARRPAEPPERPEERGQTDDGSDRSVLERLRDAL